MRHSFRPSWPDHPRSRGVYGRGGDSPGRGIGSSPLARGLRRPRLARRSGPRDHPRSRGVYTAQSPSPWPSFGSSPLARGLPVGRSSPRNATRIIPARAGFTLGRGTTKHGRPDHPRSRGVYVVWACAGLDLLGSSPLARGLRRLRRLRQVGLRIIPARAGFTNSTRRDRSPTRDHPRSRGVYFQRNCAPD